MIPVDDRHCTDRFCLLLFLSYVLGMIALTAVGLKQGNPYRLLYGYNYKGELCGGDKHPNARYITYPRVEEDVVLSGYLDGDVSLDDLNFFGICQSTCPSAGDFVCTSEAEEAVQEQMFLTNYERDTIINDCVNNWYSTIPFGDSCLNSTIHSGCFQTLFDTTSVFFRCLPEYVYEVETLPESTCTKYINISDTYNNIESYCVAYREVTKVTREQPTASNVLYDSFNTIRVTIQRYCGDLVRAYKPILASGLGVSVLVGLLYIFSLFCCVGFMVWIVVFLSLLASTSFTVYCYFKAGVITGSLLESISSEAASLLEDVADAIGSDILDSDSNSSVTISTFNSSSLPDSLSESLDYSTEYRYMAYAATVFTILLFIIIVSLLERIARAIEIFQEASKAIRQNMLLVVLPFISMGVIFAVAMAWGIATAYIASAGSFSISYLNTTVSYDPESVISEVSVFQDSFSYKNLVLAYMLFGLFWILSFVSGVNTMTIAGAVLQWFWHDKVDFGGEGRTHIPILRSFYTTIRYHLGTVAFASIIMAIVTFVRYLAAYVQRRLQALGKDNRVIRIVFCAVQAFLYCVQRCVEYVTRYSYIYTAMYGEPFCTATKMAFKTMASNIAQIALVTFLGDLIQRFGQILITIIAGLTCWIWIDSAEYELGGDLQLYSKVTPIAMSMFLAWFAAAEVLSAYDICVDCLLISFLQNKRMERLKASHIPRNKPGLDAFMDKYRIDDPKLLRKMSQVTMN